MNLGAAGGAGIAEHLHLHVVPRWVGDTNFIATVGAARVLPVALEELYDAVAPGFTGGEGHPVDLHGDRG
jgi:ATP adenylyltransferase